MNRHEAAAFAGIAENLAFPDRQRVTAANAALNFYVPEFDALTSLIADLVRDETGQCDLIKTNTYCVTHALSFEDGALCPVAAARAKVADLL